MAAQTQQNKPFNPVTGVMTWQQIQDMAEKQAAAAIAGENAPLQARVTSLGGQEATARGDIQHEGQQLLPYVQYSAQNVTAAQNQALAQEQQVFTAAGTRMNQLHQQMASEAQQLAQQMGGPVSTADFTKALAPYEQQLPNAQGSSMLHALGNAMTDTAEAQRFAGQVFPALISEEEAKSDSFFRNQIKDLQNQIDTNTGTKSDLVNKNLSQMLQDERTFRLNVLQQKAQSLKDKRDWKATQQQLKSQKLHDKLSIQAAKRAGISLGQAQQRINIERQHVSRADRLSAQRLGLSVAEFKQRQAHEAQTAKQGQARLSLSASKDAASVVDAAMGGGKPVSMTHRAYIPGAKGPGTFGTSHAGAYYDPKRKQWYKVVHETMTAGEWGQVSGQSGGHPITDPNRLYDLVRGTIPQLGRQATINLVRAKTGHKGWSPGKSVTYSGSDLHQMPIGMLRGLARDNGYQGKLGKHASRQSIIDFLMHVTPTPNPRTNHNHPAFG